MRVFLGGCARRVRALQKSVRRGRSELLDSIESGSKRKDSGIAVGATKIHHDGLTLNKLHAA
jgi:hypothetical protein